MAENIDGLNVLHSNTDNFYKKCLAAQTMKCNKQSCIEVISTLQSNVKRVQLKNEDNKEAIAVCRSIIATKDEEIVALKKCLNH